MHPDLGDDLLLAWRGNPCDVFAPDSPADRLLDAIRRGRPSWMRQAACALPENQHVDFFPERWGADVRAALAVCASCPVLAECSDWCIRTDPNPGPRRHHRGMTASARARGPTSPERHLMPSPDAKQIAAPIPAREPNPPPTEETPMFELHELAQLLNVDIDAVVAAAENAEVTYVSHVGPDKARRKVSHVSAEAIATALAREL